MIFMKNLKILLKNNPEVSKNQKAIKFLIDEYLSVSDIRSACDSANFIGADTKSNYLEKNMSSNKKGNLVKDIIVKNTFNKKGRQ